MTAMRAGGIGFRMITGGCFLRHEAAKFFDYEIVGDDRECRTSPTITASSSATTRAT